MATRSTRSRYRVDGRSASPLTLDDGAYLVGDVIDEGIGPVAVLFDIGHDDASQWRHILGLTGHAQVRPDEVDVKLGPRRGADVGFDRKPDA